MYKKILVPLDNSPSDQAIIEHIQPLARLTGASLVLVHVADGYVARLQNQLNLADSEEIKNDEVYLQRRQKELEKAGLKVRCILKLLEGRPNVIDLLKNKEIQLVVNTPAGQSPREDEIRIRTTAVYTGTPIMTTLSGAKAAALGIAALKKSGYAVKTVQEYH